MAEEQLFETEETEDKQVKEEVDPRLVTDKAKTGTTLRARNLAEKEEFRDAVDKYRVSRGKATVGEVIPDITALLESETGEAPTAISSHVNTLFEVFDVARKQVAAISACYSTIEEREHAKSQGTITDLADQLAEQREKAKASAAELEQARAEVERLQGELEDAGAEVERLQGELRKAEENDATSRDTITKLAGALAVSPEEQSALVAKLLKGE